MSFGLCFWVLMLLWLVLGAPWKNWKAQGQNTVLLILLILLGWRVFGPPLHP